MTAPLALVLSGEATVAQAARMHGCDPDRLEIFARVTVRAAVLARDGFRCQNCLRLAFDVKRRLRPGIDDRGDPKVVFGLSNVICLCAKCSDLADQRDEGMHLRGFQLKTGQDPATVPIVTPTPSGPVRAWLLPAGGRSYIPPEDGTAS